MSKRFLLSWSATLQIRTQQRIIHVQYKNSQDRNSAYRERNVHGVCNIRSSALNASHAFRFDKGRERLLQAFEK